MKTAMIKDKLLYKSINVTKIETTETTLSQALKFCSNNFLSLSITLYSFLSVLHQDKTETQVTVFLF